MWPRLDVGGGRETRPSLLLWSQALGKTRLALCPMVNQRRQVPLVVERARRDHDAAFVDIASLDLELDLIDHRLVARTSDGAIESMSLCDRTLAGFTAEYCGAWSPWASRSILPDAV